MVEPGASSAAPRNKHRDARRRNPSNRRFKAASGSHYFREVPLSLVSPNPQQGDQAKTTFRRHFANEDDYVSAEHMLVAMGEAKQFWVGCNFDKPRLRNRTSTMFPDSCVVGPRLQQDAVMEVICNLSHGLSLGRHIVSVFLNWVCVRETFLPRLVSLSFMCEAFLDICDPIEAKNLAKTRFKAGFFTDKEVAYLYTFKQGFLPDNTSKDLLRGYSYIAISKHILSYYTATKKHVNDAFKRETIHHLTCLLEERCWEWRNDYAQRGFFCAQAAHVGGKGFQCKPPVRCRGG